MEEGVPKNGRVHWNNGLVREPNRRQEVPYIPSGCKWVVSTTWIMTYKTTHHKARRQYLHSHHHESLKPPLTVSSSMLPHLSTLALIYILQFQNYLFKVMSSLLTHTMKIKDLFRNVSCNLKSKIMFCCNLFRTASRRNAETLTLKKKPFLSIWR